MVWFLLTFIFCLKKIKSIHLEFNTVCYYSNFIACLAVTKGLHLVHFTLLCRPTASQCFIISVFKGICGSHSCRAFVTESSFHCVMLGSKSSYRLMALLNFKAKTNNIKLFKANIHISLCALFFKDRYRVNLVVQGKVVVDI